MNQEPVSENEPITSLAASAAAGQRLRTAREALGLSRDDVARELRLQEKLIAALEEGDRNQLPPATFISGYLRAYARLLALPAEQLVSEYLNEQVAPSLIRSTDRSGMLMVSSRDPKFRLITYAVVAVLVLLFSAWWINQRFDFVSLEPSRTDGAELEVEAALPEPQPLLDYSPGEEAVQSDAAQPEAAEQTVGSEVSPGVTQDALPLQPLPIPAPSVSAQPAPPPSESTTITAAPVVAPPPPAVESPKPQPPLPVVTSEPLPAATPQTTLVLEYQAASWTQVEDANGRVLAYEVVRPGRKLELRGVAPFKVFLGFAPGVLVYYNGKLFPHADYQRGDLARFRVGSSADNRPLAR